MIESVNAVAILNAEGTFQNVAYGETDLKEFMDKYKEYNPKGYILRPCAIVYDNGEMVIATDRK
jgi:hypothetical protein